MLIGFMLAAGPLAGLLETIAHERMRDRAYLTPVPRYAVGVVLAGIPWTAATAATLWSDIDITTVVLVLVVGFWYVFGWAGALTWLAYERDRPRATEADAARLAAYIAGEHDGARDGDPR